MVSYLALILTICSALGVAAYSLFIRIGTSRSEGTINDALVIILLCNLVIVAPAAYILHDSVSFKLTGITAFIGAGLVATILGRVCYYKGIELASSSRTEPLKATQLIYATIIPVVILDEFLSLVHLVGILLIFLGVVLITIESQEENHTPVENVRKGIIFGLASGFFYGLEPTLAKLGFDQNISIFLGITIKIITALLGFTTYLRIKSYNFSIRPSNNWWFVAAGIANTAFLVFYYGALEMAPVTIVYPVLQTSPLFIIALSQLFIPSNLERITWKLVMSALIIVTGTIIVVTA